MKCPLCKKRWPIDSHDEGECLACDLGNNLIEVDPESGEEIDQPDN